MVYTYTVGQPYPQELVPPTAFARDGTLLQYRGHGYWEALLIFQKPTPEEIEAVTRGRIEFALAIAQGLPFVCLQFGRKHRPIIPWMDMVFHACRMVEEGQPIEELQELASGFGTPLGLAIVLTESPGSEIRVIRYVTLPPGFADALRGAIIETSPLHTNLSYNEAINEVFATITSNGLARQAIARCEVNPQEHD